VHAPSFHQAEEWIRPITTPYNDVEAVEQLFREQGKTIAAVVVEPLGVSTGLTPPGRGFLKCLRALCDAHGALLMFDETLTGIRIASGGTTALYGVSPDIVLLGPIIGSGLSIAAFGGCKEVLRHLDEDRVGQTQAGMPAFAGTASDDLLAMAAGIVTLQALGEPGFYEELEEKAARLDEGLRAAAAATGVGVRLTRVASILGMYFSTEPMEHAAAARQGDATRFSRYHRAMLDHGILLPFSPVSCMFVSAAHTNEEIDRTIEAAHEALRAMGREVGNRK
jgi:glutamate-1-semialdehyde 2,1-aminomutase